MSGGQENRGKHNLPLPPPNHPSLLTKAIQLYVVKNKVNINERSPGGMPTYVYCDDEACYCMGFIECQERES